MMEIQVMLINETALEVEMLMDGTAQEEITQLHPIE